MVTLQWPGQDTAAPDAPPRPMFDPDVERWRPLVAKYFAPQEVDKALYVITHESSGNATVPNSTGSGARGLFQIMPFNARNAGIDPNDPEASVKWAATQVANHGWTDWGEGTNYEGDNFGALGEANPYGPGGTGKSRTGSALGGLVGSAIRPSSMGQADSATADVLNRVPYSQPASDAYAYDATDTSYHPSGYGPTSGTGNLTLPNETLNTLDSFNDPNMPDAKPTLRSSLDLQRQGQSQYGGIPGATIGAAGNVVDNTYGKVNLDVPVLSPAINRFVKPVISTAANAAAPIAKLGTDALGLPSPGDIAESLVPSKSADLVAAVAPLVGEARPLIGATGREAAARVAASSTADRLLPARLLQDERRGAAAAEALGGERLAGARAGQRFGPEIGGGPAVPPGGLPDEPGSAARAAGQINLSGMGQAISDNYYRKVFADLQAGVSQSRAGVEEQFAQAAFRRGMVNSPEDVKAAMQAAQTVRASGAQGPELQRALNESLNNFTPPTAAATLPPAGKPPQPPAAASVRPAPAPLPEPGTSGIEAALAAKREATLTPGRVFGEEGSLQRRAVGALNPSVDIPQDIHVANQARAGVQSSLRTELGSIEMPAYKKVEALFEAEHPRYIGPPDRPLKETWTDYAENPRFYQASPELTAAKEELRQAQHAALGEAVGKYGVDVKPFQGSDPGGVYVPHMQSRETIEQAVTRTEASLSSRSSVVKERAYDSLSDRVAKDAKFKPELDAATLADVHSGSLASMAANNTFKAGAGGKTLTEVIDELHPRLVKQRDYVANRVAAVKAKIDLAEERLAQHGAAADVLAREKAAIESRAVPKFVEVSEADKQTPELKKLQVQLGELKIRANSIDRAAAKVSGKGMAADLRMRQAQDELSALEPQLAELRTRYHTAGTGDYVYNNGGTYKYHDPKTHAAIEMLRKKSFNNAFIDTAIEAGNTARKYGLGPDFSPLTIQGGLGFFSHPDVAIKNAVGLAKAAFSSSEDLRAALSPELIKRFEFASGRRLGSFAEEADQGAEGIRIKGRPFKKFNSALERIVDFGTLKAFESDSALLVRLGETSQNVADHEAANSISKLIPRINNAETARSVQRVKLEGVLPTSRSFAAQPFSLAKDYASGIAKVATGRPGELLGRERLALARVTTMMGTMGSIAVGSALLFADANGLTPAEAVKQVLDPHSSRFMSLIVGSAGSVPIGGPFRSAFLGVYRTGARGPAGAVQYAKGRLSPVLGAGFDVATNRDWKGDPVRTGSPWNQTLQTALHVGEAGNLLASGAIQGAQQGGIEGLAEGTASGLAGVNYSERGMTDARNREAMKRYGQHYEDLLTSQQQQVDALPSVAGKKGPATAYAQDRDRRVQQRTDKIAQKVDAWNQGKLSDGPLPQQISDIKAAFYQSLDDLRKDKNNAAMFEKLPDRKHQTTLDGFFATQTTHTDGSVDWDSTIVDRDRYLAKLQPNERSWLEDYIGVQDAKKLPIEKEIGAYNDKREQLGYFKDGLTQPQKTQLDRDNPDVDVQTWKYYGGQEDKTKNPDPVLNSAAAVEQALKDPFSQTRDVKLAGLARPINQDAQSRAAWEYSKAPLLWYQTSLITDNWKAEAKRLFESTGDAGYNKPDLEAMDSDHSGRIKSNLHTKAQKSSPELDAFLYWWGAPGSVATQEAADKLADLMKKYGNKPPK